MSIKLGAEAGENILKHLLERYIFGTISHVPIIMFFFVVFASYCILTRLGSIMVRFINKMKLCG